MDNIQKRFILGRIYSEDNHIFRAAYSDIQTMFNIQSIFREDIQQCLILGLYEMEYSH